MDDLLSEFLTETNEGLAVLDVELVELERTPGDRELLGNIFRVVHTIKGACGFLGLPRLEAVAHAGENVLCRVREGGLEVSPAAVSLILECLDRIRALVSDLETAGAEPEGDDSDLIGRLEALAEGGGSAKPAPKPEPAPAGEARAAAESPRANQSIRVNLELLDNLMTMVSELVLTRNQLLQILRGRTDSDFAVPLQRLNHVVSELQDGVMKARMQPIGKAWAKLPRMVRDLSIELGKKIELVMTGAETELDRQVLELITDPLTHMVRNAADHGLESSEARIAAGKPETGKVSLNAYHEGGHIIIEISDDGRGLAVEKIKAQAVAKGLASEAGFEGMSEQQVQKLIFRPGFTTAAEVTSVSGRGVGMDIVRTNIEKIGGTLELSSAAGQGTSLTIRIPLTLAIVSALIVECAQERFAIPQISVLELVRVSSRSGTAIEHIDDTPVLRLRDRLLPLVGLRELLKLDSGTQAGPSDQYIVVAQVGTHTFGIVVDRVLDTEEIVVKPVARILRDNRVFCGNTILGDGSVVMILDPGGIAAAGGAADLAAEVEETASDREAARAEETVAMLVFRAVDAAPKAVPLSLVSRLEEIDLAKVEVSNGQSVVQYRGRLMPLVQMEGARALGTEGRQPVLVFTERDRTMGLVVDRIVDIVEDRLELELTAKHTGYVGSAVIDGQATEVVDVAHYLTQAFGDRFGTGAADVLEGEGNRKLLLVDDSPFVRTLLQPLLSAAGYEVTCAPNAGEALRRRESGEAYDVIVSDIEMPGMSGFEFAAAVKTDPRWSGVPMIALSSFATERDLDRGRAAGFRDYLAKNDRETLLSALHDALADIRGAA